jgi:eukaryotic-like serine/threonine-protein kinase
MSERSSAGQPGASGKVISAIEVATASMNQGAVPPGRSTRANPMALLAGSLPHHTGEIAFLLRGRLRVVVLILLAGFGYTLVRILLRPHLPGRAAPYALACHAGLVLGLAVVAGILWSRMSLSLRRLRSLELAVFGAAAALMAWLQYGHLSEMGLSGSAGSAPDPALFSLRTSSGAFYWFFLIVAYGTFIPNSWQRCVAVVAVLVLIPLLLTTAVCLTNEALHPYLTDMLLTMTGKLALGAALAIFGSYKIHALQQEAFRARELGQYRLKERLGSGGMGEVYRAEHRLLRRPCAVKLIRPEHAGDADSLARFEREVQATATLTHPNTVQIYDYGHAEDGTFYYAMEYLPGLSLHDLVTSYGPLEPARAIHFLRQVCGALHEAHAIGLVHRDIKPSNIIACERGGLHDVVKLLDFGLVQSPRLGPAAAPLTQRGTIMGSPPYMSPEQSMGKDLLDARSDIYSLGATAYFLLTGQAPFVCETMMQVLIAHAHDRPVPLTEARSDLPADLDRVIMRCLEKEPGQRFPDANALAQALAQCAAAGQWTEERAAQWWQAMAEGANSACIPPETAAAAPHASLPPTRSAH